MNRRKLLPAAAALLLVASLTIGCELLQAVPTPTPAAVAEPSPISSPSATATLPPPTPTPEPAPPTVAPEQRPGRLNEQLATKNANVGFRDLGWSPEGELLAVAGEAGVLLFSAAYVSEPLPLHEGVDTVAVAFHPSGSFLVTAAEDGTLATWDAASLASLSTLDHDDPFRGQGLVRFNEAGDLLIVLFPASSEGDGRLLVYDVTELTEPVVVYDRQIETETITSAFAVAPDGSRAAISHFLGPVEVYSLRSAGPPEWTFRTRGPAMALAFGDDNRSLAAGTLAGTVEINDVQSREPVGEIPPPPGVTRVNIHDIVFRAGYDELIFGSSFRYPGSEEDRGSVTWWSLEDGASLGTYSRPAPVERVALDPTGRYLAMVSDAAIEVVDLTQPIPTPVPLSPTPIPSTPTPFVGGECDSRTQPIQAGTGYSEYLESTTQPYPANCRHYCLWIPDGMANLTIRISGFDVDLDLYLGYGELETVMGSSIVYGESYLWKSNAFGTGDEQVSISSPEGGPYYVEVCSYEGAASPFQLATTLR